MIEVYVTMALLGIGYFINKKKDEDNLIHQKDSKIDKPNNIKESDNSFKKTIYDSDNTNFVKKTEAGQAKKLFDENKKKKEDIKHETKSNNFFKNMEQSDLSGTYVNMTHNNMTPFFKGTINKMENKSPLLEQFTGNSDLYRKKNEVSNLFVPQKDITTGLPVNTDIYQGRFQKPIIMNNVTPMPKIQVGKGIGRGYDSQPVGGYQQLDERDYAMPKTVDELRVKNNPKVTYKGVVLDGQKPIKRANKPIIRKNKAETFYVNTPDRYFTTTGTQIKQTSKPKIELKYTTRPETNVHYKGNAFTNKKNGEHPEVLAPFSTFRKLLRPYDPANPTLTNEGKGEDYQYGKDSILIYDNNRNVTSEKTYSGNVISLVKAITAPVTDIMKVNKKEYTIENAREKGHLQSHVRKQTLHNDDIARTTIKETLLQESTNINLQGTKKHLVYDPNDVARTTLKETLLQESELTNIDARRTGAIVRNDDKAATTVRETLDPIETALNIYPDKKGNIAKDPNDIARTTIKETLIDNNREGNVNVDLKGAYTETNYEAKDTHKQYLSQNEYAGNIDLANADGYKIAPTDIRPTQKEDLCDNEYAGNPVDQTSKEPISYEAIYNATLNEIKEELEKGRNPTQTSVKVNASSNEIGVKLDKKQNVNFEPSQHIAKTFINQPLYKNLSEESITREKEEVVNTRFDPSILETLDENPYDIKIFS